MSREIKFRAWDEKHKQFNYFDLLGYFNDHAYYELGVKNVCQYTGLKDKNGKSIYEGDILDCDQFHDGAYSVVTFINRGCFVAEHPRDPDNWSLLDDYNFIIIGNIYQNPELLETEK